MIPFFDKYVSRGNVMVSGVFIPEKIWHLLIGIALTAIVTILLNVHSAFGNTQDKVLLHENRLSVLETEAKNQGHQLSSIQGNLATNTAVVSSVQADVAFIKKLLMEKAGKTKDDG